jgi:hypothetical protein
VVIKAFFEILHPLPVVKARFIHTSVLAESPGHGEESKHHCSGNNCQQSDKKNRPHHGTISSLE